METHRARSLPQNAASVQGLALTEAVALHLVEQSPEAHAEELRGLPAVAAPGLERLCDRHPLTTLRGLPERSALRSLLLVGAGSGERSLLEIVRLQRFLIAQHRRPLDGVLQLTHVAPPGLLLQPPQRGRAQRHAPAQPPPQPRREVAGQRGDVRYAFAQRG